MNKIKSFQGYKTLSGFTLVGDVSQVDLGAKSLLMILNNKSLLLSVTCMNVFKFFFFREMKTNLLFCSM